MRLYPIFVLAVASCLQLAARCDPGLAVRIQQGGARDFLKLPQPSLHVPAGQAPSLFLKPGPFEAELSGWISVDLRAQYTFTAEFRGELKMILNGIEILSANSDLEDSHASRAVRLNKGTNAFRVHYSSPIAGDATLRFFWRSKSHAVAVPIPPGALTHDASAEFDRAVARSDGAFLVRQYRCTECHRSRLPARRDAPAFDGIGSRLNPAWVRNWLSNPASHAHARMPKMFHGPNAARHSEAVAAFLSLSTASAPAADFDRTESRRASGAALFSDLRCGSCHSAPGHAPIADRISLNHIAEKFLPAALPEYLQLPHAHYPANPMPNFKLTQSEAEALAAFLLHELPPAEPVARVADLAPAGKELIQTSGCLNCHALDLPNQFRAPSLEDLMRASSQNGCLDPDSERSPRFNFAPGEAAAIKAFLAAKNSTAIEHTVPNQTATHLLDTLRCAQCHEDSGLPSPATLGGKLNSDWSAQFIAGTVPYKPRPWLKERMPSFPAQARDLATGLAALHGYPAAAPPPPAPQPDLTSVGEKLISAHGVFSCVACHALGTSSLAQIVESPGVNFAYSSERLRPSFFQRWVMNPVALDANTKMPVYFDAEARSQLTDYFDGDAHKQIDAMWQYLSAMHHKPSMPKE